MAYNKYPSFWPLQKADKPLFDEAFIKNPPEISEFTFTNLFAWREIYRIKVSILGDLLILASESGEESRFFPPIGPVKQIKPAIEKVLHDSKGTFIRIPEEVKGLFDNDGRFSAELDLDNSDYLFKAEDLISLKGKKYDGKRNLIKKFKSTYEYQYARLDESNARYSLEFVETWCSIKGCDNVKGLIDERSAIREIIENFSAFGLIGGAIKVSGDIRAVAIAEKLNNNTLVMHVLKADPGMAGLYQAINNEFLSYQAGGFEYINLEQDLGEEGLRKSKLSYHPARMVRKYTLKARNW